MMFRRRVKLSAGQRIDMWGLGEDQMMISGLFRRNPDARRRRPNRAIADLIVQDNAQ